MDTRPTTTHTTPATTHNLQVEGWRSNTQAGMRGLTRVSNVIIQGMTPQRTTTKLHESCRGADDETENLAQARLLSCGDQQDEVAQLFSKLLQEARLSDPELAAFTSRFTSRTFADPSQFVNVWACYMDIITDRENLKQTGMSPRSIKTFKQEKEAEFRLQCFIKIVDGLDPLTTKNLESFFKGVMKFGTVYPVQPNSSEFEYRMETLFRMAIADRSQFVDVFTRRIDEITDVGYLKQIGMSSDSIRQFDRIEAAFRERCFSEIEYGLKSLTIENLEELLSQFKNLIERAKLDLNEFDAAELGANDIKLLWPRGDVIPKILWHLANLPQAERVTAIATCYQFLPLANSSKEKTRLISNLTGMAMVPEWFKEALKSIEANPNLSFNQLQEILEYRIWGTSRQPRQTSCSII